MNAIENRVLITTPREGLQHPNIALSGYHVDDPRLVPPAELIENKMVELLADLINDPQLMVELPTPVSCPSAVLMIQRLLTTANSFSKGKENPIVERLPVHTRMDVKDFDLALDCGARAIHLYGNSSNGAKDKGKSISGLLANLEVIADHAYKGLVRRLRASLEQATDTDPAKILEFVSGVNRINEQYRGLLDGKNIITTIGLPDTNGIGTQVIYGNILTDDLARLLQEGKLELSAHQHDDNQQALDNTKNIVAWGRQHEIPVIVETIQKDAPGERVGIKPYDDELGDVGVSAVIPASASQVLKGVIPWDHTDDFLRFLAKHYNTAGVHTDDMGRYSNGLSDVHPHPGLYSIMGAKNLGYIWQHLLHLSADEIETKENRNILKAAAVVGREIAMQKGNLPHGYAIALARLCHDDPEKILKVRSEFGDQKEWLTKWKKESSDITDIYDRLQEMVLRM